MARTPKVQNKKAYICGPMTGYENYNFDAFNEVASDLRSLGGIDVVNPAESHDGDQSLAWEEYLSWDLDQVRTCDYLVALEGWQATDATGARLEIQYALAHSIPVYNYDPWSADFLGTEVNEGYAVRDFVKAINNGDTFGWDDWRTEPQSSLQEADGLVNGPRAQAYDHPMENFGRIVRLWNALLHEKLTEPITEEEHAMMMMQVKMARLLHSPDHRDSYVDIAGYVGTYEKLVERRAEDDAEFEEGYHSTMQWLTELFNDASEDLYDEAFIVEPVL